MAGLEREPVCDGGAQARAVPHVHQHHQQHVRLQRDGGAGGVHEDQGAGPRYHLVHGHYYLAIRLLFLRPPAQFGADTPR